jgi:predicted  nucleic acid-binding Zn-ribbon protein
MNADLEKLIRLQRAETDLRATEADLTEVPRQKTEAEARLAADRARLEAARSELEACQKSRKQHEAGLQDLEAKRSKYKGQLMEVKTNKEYTAVLHEIETVEREIRRRYTPTREPNILTVWVRADPPAAEVKQEEGLFKAAEERLRAEARSLEERARSLEERARRLAAERDAAAATVPEALRELFQRVARLRGSAVAEARDGMCQTCHVMLRLQMYVDVKHNEAILQCPSCSRILYYEPAPPTSSPQP